MADRDCYSPLLCSYIEVASFPSLFFSISKSRADGWGGATEPSCLKLQNSLCRQQAVHRMLTLHVGRSNSCYVLICNVPHGNIHVIMWCHFMPFPMFYLLCHCTEMWHFLLKAVTNGYRQPWWKRTLQQSLYSQCFKDYCDLLSIVFFVTPLEYMYMLIILYWLRIM